MDKEDKKGNSLKKPLKKKEKKKKKIEKKVKKQDTKVKKAIATKPKPSKRPTAGPADSLRKQI